MWLFTEEAGILLLVVNTKLVHVARYVTRGGRIHRLRPGVFWLNRPWLLLPVLKARARPPAATLFIHPSAAHECTYTSAAQSCHSIHATAD